MGLGEMTTHAPFVPSDMPRERVFIFTKEMGEIKVRHPGIQTFGSRFDSILEECFGVRPPISGLSRAEIKRLMASNDVDEVRDGISRLGNSVDKVFLVDKLKRLSE
jgi:predicted ATP-binding protein involved in virulence